MQYIKLILPTIVILENLREIFTEADPGAASDGVYVLKSLAKAGYSVTTSMVSNSKNAWWCNGAS